MTIDFTLIPETLSVPETNQPSSSLKHNKFSNNKILFIGAAGAFLVGSAPTIDYEQLIRDNNTKCPSITEVYKIREMDNVNLDYLTLIENEETILTSVVEQMLMEVNSDYSDINKIIEDNFWDLI